MGSIFWDTELHYYGRKWGKNFETTYYICQDSDQKYIHGFIYRTGRLGYFHLLRPEGLWSLCGFFLQQMKKLTTSFAEICKCITFRFTVKFWHIFCLFNLQFSITSTAYYFYLFVTILYETIILVSLIRIILSHFKLAVRGY